MDVLTFIGLLFLGIVVTLFAVVGGNGVAQPSQVSKSVSGIFMRPSWLFILEIIIVVAASIVLYQSFWLACGTWLVGGLFLGYITEFLFWKTTPKEKIEAWVENAKAKKKEINEEICKQKSHQWGEWGTTDSNCFKIRNCNRCGIEERQDSGVHSWGEWKDGEVMCQQMRVCSNCGLKDVRFDHDYKFVNRNQKWLKDTYQTGKGIQIETYKCSRCGDEKRTEEYQYVTTDEDNRI